MKLWLQRGKQSELQFSCGLWYEGRTQGKNEGQNKGRQDSTKGGILKIQKAVQSANTNLDLIFLLHISTWKKITKFKVHTFSECAEILSHSSVSCSLLYA